MTLLQGDQIPLIVPALKQRYWLQVESEGRIYTYNECQKAFTLEDWDAKPYASIGRARTARYAMRSRLKAEFPNGEVLIYDPIAKVVVDPLQTPPEPEPQFPLCDNYDLLPSCPECGAILIHAPFEQCPTCAWDVRPLQDKPIVVALKKQLTQLYAQIDAIQRSGAVAPTRCNIEPYTVSKRLGDGKKSKFRYFRVRSEGEYRFQNGSGSETKSLHLGTETNVAYLDWQERVKRRNAIAQLQRFANSLEKQLQSHQSAAKVATRT